MNRRKATKAGLIIVAQCEYRLSSKGRSIAGKQQGLVDYLLLAAMIAQQNHQFFVAPGHGYG